jgi:hypothetical protein
VKFAEVRDELFDDIFDKKQRIESQKDRAELSQPRAGSRTAAPPAGSGVVPASLDAPAPAGQTPGR